MSIFQFFAEKKTAKFICFDPGWRSSMLLFDALVEAHDRSRFHTLAQHDVAACSTSLTRKVLGRRHVVDSILEQSQS